MRTDRSAPEESTSMTTGTSDRYCLPCSMAFIVASATAVLSLSRRCSERPSPFTTAATLSIARCSFPGSLHTFNFARPRQVPLRPFCSTRLEAVTILPLSDASPEVMSSSCSQTPPTKRLCRTYASCLLPAHEPRPHLPIHLSKRTLREPLIAFPIPLSAPVELLPTGRPESELVALRCAPSTTPTPSRTTSSPPRKPPSEVKPTTTKERTMATNPGSPGAFARSSQLTTNSVTMTTLVAPCHIPTALARVPEGSPASRSGRTPLQPDHR